jgi:cystathionine gamma-lyase
MKNSPKNFDTLCIHGGQQPEPITGAVMTPIFQTSTYAQQSPAQHKGYEYSRTHNPTRTALEKNLAALENASFGFCFASGCAATTILMLGLNPKDHIIAFDDLYGGTRRLFTKVFENFGLSFTFSDLNNLTELIRPETKMIWLETPSNPLLKLIDIQNISEIARRAGILVVVDNTFATPALQRPLDLGADIVVHSTTKY